VVQPVDSAEVDALAERLVTPRFITITAAGLFGLGIGPFLGEYLSDTYGFDAVVRASFVISLLSAGLAFAIPAKPPIDAQAPGLTRSKDFLHKDSILPGILLTLSLIGFVGYTTFLALYLDDLTDGEASAGAIGAPLLGVIILITGCDRATFAAGAIAVVVGLVGVCAMPAVPPGGVRSA
jgi:MFS family permease